MRSIQGFKNMLSIKNKLDNPIVSSQATITDWPYKGRHHLGVASNDLLVVALAIESKRCHLPTNNIECYNSPSHVISAQKCNHLDKEKYVKFYLDTVEIFSKTIADIHYTKDNSYANTF